MDLYLFEFMFGLLPQVILLCTPFYFYYLYQVRLRVEYLEKLTTGKQLNFDKYDGIYLPKLLAYENYLYFVLYQFPVWQQSSYQRYYKFFGIQLVLIV